RRSADLARRRGGARCRYQNATGRRGRGTCSRRSSAGLRGLAAAGARLGVPAVPALAAVLAVMAGVAVAAAPLGDGHAAGMDAVGGKADVGLDAHRLVVGLGGGLDHIRRLTTAASRLSKGPVQTGG